MYIYCVVKIKCKVKWKECDGYCCIKRFMVVNFNVIIKHIIAKMEINQITVNNNYIL